MTEPIQVGDQTLEIEVRPITLIVPATNMQVGPPIRYPKRMTLTPEDTVYHARRVKKLHAEFEHGWRLFMANTTPPLPVDYSVDPDTIRGMYIGAIHLMGLLDMSLKLSDLFVPVAWKFPETYMHPGWQVGLGDLVIWLSMGRNPPKSKVKPEGDGS